MPMKIYKNEKTDSINVLLKLFDHQFNQILYFQTDLARFKILLEVIKNFNNKKIVVIEDLIEKIPKSLASRAHKLNIITDATRRGYFIKEVLKSDLRKKMIVPSESLITEFNNFIKIFD